MPLYSTRVGKARRDPFLKARFPMTRTNLSPVVTRRLPGQGALAVAGRKVARVVKGGSVG